MPFSALRPLWLCLVLPCGLNTERFQLTDSSSDGMLLLLLTTFVLFIQRQSHISAFVLSRKISRQGSYYSSKENPSSEPLPSASTSTGNACPFVKSYKNYRIDLTSVPRKKQSNSFFNFLFPNESALKDKLSKQHPNCSVEWCNGQSGIDAMATLWRSCCCCSNDNGSSKLLCFPDTPARTIRQWMDILSWLQENVPQQLQTVTAEYFQEGEISVIKLTIDTAKDNSNNNLLTESQQQSYDHNVITKRTQAWVKRVLVDLQICPFTKSTKMAGQGLSDVGIPVGRIAYHTSCATPQHTLHLLADTWEAIRDMIQAGPAGTAGVNSILLAAPAYDDAFDLWAGPIFKILEACVVAANAEPQLGVVCFHPSYAIPDGTSWPGFGHMHSLKRLQKWVQEDDTDGDNDDKSDKQFLTEQEIAAGGAWQRRTPHATINVLRADQLAAAEGKRNTPQLYRRNINVLVGKSSGLGSDKLQELLEAEQRLET